jgi:acyl carrier protein
MGLDGVELVMAFEESFGISINDADAAAAVTPGMVVDLVCRQLDMTDARACQTQRAFYLLRRALMNLTQKPRRAITPTTPLRDLFDTNDARVIWPQLQAAVDARGWPKLARPRWLENLLLVTFVFLVLGLPFLLCRLCTGWFLSAGFFVAMFIAALLLMWGVTVVTRPLLRAIPRRLQTVGDLTPWVLTSNQIQWSRELVRTRVKRIVIEQLGIAEAKYSEDANFVRDFGMD